MSGNYDMPCHTSDGINHGFGRLEFCLEAMVERYEDGYLLCPILWSGGKCEECMEIFERRTDE